MDYGNEHFNFPFSRVGEYIGTRLKNKEMDVNEPPDDSRMTNRDDKVHSLIEKNAHQNNVNQNCEATKETIDNGEPPTKKKRLDVEHSKDLKTQQLMERRIELKEVAESSRNAKLNVQNEVRLSEIAKNLENLRNEIDYTVKAFKDNFSNELDMRNRLTDLMIQLDNITNDVEKGLKPTEDDKIICLINVENQQLNDMEASEEVFKDLESSTHELMNAITTSKINSNDPIKTEILSNIAIQLENHLPNLQKQNTQVEMKKALRIAKESIKRNPYSDIVLSIQKTRESLVKVVVSAKNGDQKEVDEDLQSIQIAKNRIKEFTRNEAIKSEDSEKQKTLEMLVAALDESHKSLPGLANYAVRKSQNDEKTLKKLLENKVAMEKILDQIVDSSNAILLAQENTVAKQEKYLEGNVAIGNLRGSNEAINAISIETKTLSALIAKTIENFADPARKKQLEIANKRLEENASIQENFAKDLEPNSKEQKAFHKLNAVIKSSQAALASISALVNPSLLNKLFAAANEELLFIADNLVALQNGNGIIEGMKRIQEKQMEVNDLLEKATATSKNQNDQEILNEIRMNLTRLSNQLVDATNNNIAKENRNDHEAHHHIFRLMEEQLQWAVDTLHDCSNVKALVETKKTRNFGAKLRNSVSRKDALDDVLERASEFLISLNRLIGQIYHVVDSQSGFSNLSKGEKEALKLDLRLALDSLMNSLNDNPKDPFLKIQLSILLIQLDSTVNINPTVHDTINTLIGIELEQLHNFEMMDVENSKKTEEFLKDLEKTNKRLIEEIQNKANKKIKDRSDIFSTTITKLERQFPHLPKQERISPKELKETLQKLREILKTNLCSDIVVAMFQVHEGIQKVTQSAKREDKNGVNLGLNKIQAATNRFKELTRNEAVNFDDPERKTRFDNLISEMEKFHERAKLDFNFQLFSKNLRLIFEQFRNSTQTSFWYDWFKVLVFNETFGSLNQQLPPIILQCFEQSSLFTYDIFDIRYGLPPTPLLQSIPGIVVFRDHPTPSSPSTFAGIPLYQKSNKFKPRQVYNLSSCNQNQFHNKAQISRKQHENYCTVAGMGLKIGKQRFCITSGHLLSQTSTVQKNIQQEILVSSGRTSKKLGSNIPQVIVNEHTDFLLLELDDGICFHSDQKISKLLTGQDLTLKRDHHCSMQSPGGELRTGVLTGEMQDIIVNGIELDEETHRIISTLSSKIELEVLLQDDTLTFVLDRANFRINEQIVILVDEEPIETEVIVKSSHLADQKRDISDKWHERDLNKESRFQLHLDLEEQTFQNSTKLHFSLQFKNGKASQVQVSAVSFVPFANPGDSGSLVYFQDVENDKKIEAFGLIRSACDEKNLDDGIFVVTLIDHITEQISASFPSTTQTYPRRMHSINCDFNSGKTQQEIEESGTKTCSSAEKSQLISTGKRQREIQHEFPQENQEEKRQKT